MEQKENKQEIDYEKIGLKSGLEIHQQLDTHKLFCECPSILRNDEPLFQVQRKLNPVIGETGQIDAAALYEKSKDKTFLYNLYDTNCLVELDEEPPHSINQKALEIALQIALLFNCKIFPETQVMRKTVIDGSNTSGFQRTVLIAHDGYIETTEGKVGIDTIALEEDAARVVKNDKENKTKTYNLDRLGIPLVEIVTKPDLKTPEQIKEAALKIGEILRACNVRRGIGTIRQDVNISITGSKRVEIKGFQDPKIMLEVIDNEIQRQRELVKQKKSINEVRKANPDATTTYLRPMPGAARMYPETDIELLKIPHNLINELKKDLPKLKSEHKSYLKEFGLNDELIKLLLKQNKIEEFKTLLNTIENPKLIAKTITLLPQQLAMSSKKTLEQIEQILNIDIFEKVLSEVDKTINENDVSLVLKKIIEGKSLEEAIKKEKIDLTKEINQLIEEKPGLSINAYMGLIMAKLKGQVSGSEIIEELKKRIK